MWHVTSRKNGGEMIIDNLRPICGTCNKSISSENMEEFMEKYGYNKCVAWNGKDQPDDKVDATDIPTDDEREIPKSIVDIKKELELHKKDYEKMKGHYCSVCVHFTKVTNSMNKHVKSNSHRDRLAAKIKEKGSPVDPVSEKYKCDECGQILAYKKSLAYHQRNHCKYLAKLNNDSKQN